MEVPLRLSGEILRDNLCVDVLLPCPARLLVLYGDADVRHQDYLVLFPFESSGFILVGHAARQVVTLWKEVLLVRI